MPGPEYDPKLPDYIALCKRSHGMPQKLRKEAQEEQEESVPQPVSEEPPADKAAQPAEDEESTLADRAEISLTTPGEEMRPKDGTVDPADAR